MVNAKRTSKKAAPGKKGRTAKSKAKSGASSNRARGKAWTFPRNTLEEALRIARAIEDKNAGNPIRASDLASAVGYRQATDWRFGELLHSANQYGLVSGTGATATVKLENIGEGVVAPGSSEERQAALVEASQNVEQFRDVENFYGEKRLPEDEFLENTLVRDFNVPRDRVSTFIKVFAENRSYLKLYKPSSDTPAQAAERQQASTLGGTGTVEHHPEPAQTSVRRFLDTCFVMMPFGEWFDRYYQQIYVQAIKDAGFEPVRADELFSTGSVVEQIWEQITKSTVLLADLTGKNANVFYELGLAHAAFKPVVFTTSDIDDVPFDLRHLRVITYDIREPEWSKILAAKVTNYLKTAKDDPIASIPQPFREAPNNRE